MTVTAVVQGGLNSHTGHWTQKRFVRSSDSFDQVLHVMDEAHTEYRQELLEMRRIKA
jgi:hypothetical protein